MNARCGIELNNHPKRYAMSNSIFARTLLPRAAPIALLLLAAGCNPAAAPPGGFPPAPVNVMTVEPKDIPVTYEYTAQTAGYREVEVRARVTGILQQRNYKEGTVVRKGQSLFTVDPAPFQVALARAEADLAVTEARHAQARRDVIRLKPVVEAKAVSQKELDDATAAEQISAAEVTSARARVNEAKLNLEYTRVESPITGIASRAVVSEGSLVSGPSVLLTSVTQADPMYVIFGIPDREHLALQRDVEAGRLKLPAGGRFKADVRLADGSTYAHSGTVNFTDVRISNQTGTSEARAELPNANGVLRAGQFVRIVLSGAMRPAAIVVPQRAVLDSPAGKFVYLVNAENKAEPRPVEVGDWAGENWVINAGLKPGERVIVDGVLKIGPGAPVQVGDPMAKPPAGAAAGNPPAQPAADAAHK